MKYDMKEYNSAVSYYKRIMKDVKGKNIIIVTGTENRKAYLSIAPLSEAAHELGKDINVFVEEKRSGMLAALESTWLLYERLKKGEGGKGPAALKGFIAEAEKKAKGKFGKLFEKPEILLRAKDSHFSGTFTAGFKEGWFREQRQKDLLKTCSIICTQVLNLKRNERLSVGFITMPKRKGLKKPIEDYLDSYAICWAMKDAAKSIAKGVSMGASTSKETMREPMNRVTDLRLTLLGCELTKHSDEPVFKRFSELSKHIGSEKIGVADASFSISDKGYPGKHLFGELFGYPAPGNRTRWQSPGGFIYKLDYYPQTKDDPRKPLSRVAFTETLPVDVFILTSNIDWFAMKKRNDALVAIARRCEKFVVKSNVDERYRTEFEVGLIKPDGRHRIARGSDIETRSKINRNYLKRTGTYSGTMANIPGGEMFITPEYLKGTVSGDVVISIDQSYVLDEKKPFVISASEKGYRVIDGPKSIVDKFNKKKRDAWKSLLEQEKNRSLPKEVIALKKGNFSKIGEFAINTNPKAKLCDYLIVNEKIANMIHVAMGSGFEADRATEYHTDVVINAKRQKLDIYGIEEKTGKEIWVLKKGKFVV